MAVPVAVAGGIGDRTLFLGPRIPNQVKALPKLLSSLDKQVFRALVKLIVADFEGKEIAPESYSNIKESSGTVVNIDLVYSGLYTLLRAALRQPEGSLKPEVFKDDLRELKISEEFIADLASVVYGPRRAVIEKSCLDRCVHLPKLEKLRWRVDVAISSSALTRVLEPSILMELTTDGKKHVFEVQPAEFHKLRFAVATLLREMQDLEKRNILKVQV